MKKQIPERLRYKTVCYLWFCMFPSVIAMGQAYEFTGKITSKKHIAIPFVNVVLYAVDDTTKTVQGTVTDLQGNYRFSGVEKGKYLLKATAVGYENVDTFVNMVNENVIYNITMQENIRVLDEVVVTATGRTQHYADRTVYGITHMEKKKATSSFDLLENIPKIRIDNINNKITSVRGEAVKILINGLNAQESDLLSIKPEEVIRIEHYDFPPARYATSDIAGVVNIITRKSIEGIKASINLQNAVTTGFGNDLLNIKYNRNNSQLNFTYYLSYRDYDERVQNNFLKYTFNDTRYEKNRLGLNSPMYYIIKDFDFDFLHKKDNHYTFRLNFNPYVVRADRENFQHVNVSHPIQENRFSTIKSKEHNISRYKIDLYVESQLNNDQEVIFNIVGTYFNSNHQSEHIETNMMEDTTLYNYLKTEGKKYSLIGEAIYVKKTDKINISTGLKYKQAYASQDIINTLESGDNNSNTAEIYGYMEVSGKREKFSYTLSAGISYNRFDENVTNSSFDFTTFRPLASLSYDVSKSFNVRFKYVSRPIIPSLAQLSNTRYYMDENLVYAGNPLLDPYTQHKWDIECNYSHPQFKFSSGFNYIYADNPILTQFKYDDKYIVQINDNQSRESKNVFWTDISIYPFKSKWLDINLYGEFYIYKNKIHNFDEISMNDKLLYTSISANYKKWTAIFRYQNSYDLLSSQSIITQASYSYMALQYKTKNLLFGFGLYYPLEDSWKALNRTVEKTLVERTGSAEIFDNGSMFVFNFNYNFSWGRKIEKSRKKIHNQDNDPGVLQVE